ncbi:MAG: thioredoxin [Myxococcota bacterium]
MKTVVLMAVALAVLAGCKSSSGATEARPKGHLRLVPAPATPPDQLAPLIARERSASAAAGRTLLVYVGAVWCEPCTRFHDAAEKGQLDADFGDLDLLVFDAEADAERLLLAGYESRLIPLLVIPGPDGRATGQRMEGSVKGDAVADMRPRLKKLLGR